MMRLFQRTLLGVVVLAAIPASAVTLVDDGQARASIVARTDTPSVRFAAEELQRYIALISGARLPLYDNPHLKQRVELGTFEALGLPAQQDGDEAWRIETREGRLLLAGGSDRGVLYAVYHLLEEGLGVRWWTPWDETVPKQRRIRLRRFVRSGAPAFEYRDLFGLRGSSLFHLRSRLNGHFSFLPEDRGGAKRFAPPFHVHTFDRLYPASEHFEKHPERFAMRGGLRSGDKTQWCLTSQGLLEKIVKLQRETLAELPPNAPVLIDLSPNDWTHHCDCDACAAIVRDAGGESAPLLRFVSEVARRLAPEFPHARWTTLAYRKTFQVTEGPIHPAVVVRVADLYQRNFGASLHDRSNRDVLKAVEAWGSIAPNLHYWDYRVTFHPTGDLPRADSRWIGADYRALWRLGVRGVFVQLEFADVADLRDLEVWIVAKLLEDPHRSERRLEREFLRGYYGAAAPQIRRYLNELERQVRRETGKLGYAPDAEDFSWLTPNNVRHFQQLFDRAEARVADQPRVLERVRGARIALDRATLASWERWQGASPEALTTLDKSEVLRRYQTTRQRRIDQRLRHQQASLAQQSLEAEIQRYGAMHE